eukprot:RCo019363
MWAAETFLALSFLHHSGVFYRDLKPENLLLDPQGHLRLADLGVCKDFKVDLNSHTDVIRVRTGSLVGTPAYVAPDILLGKPYTHSVDWWCFGVLLFRMLCGALPFAGPKDQQIFRSILQEKVDFSSYRWLSPAARDLICGLLEKAEGDRLTAAEIRPHLFFEDLDWDAVEAKACPPPGYTPPSVPVGAHPD